MSQTLRSDFTNINPGRGRSLLVVDDDPVQLKLARLHFTEAGFAVHATSSAVEALDLARKSRPQAIISDVLMNELDGFALCRLLRTAPELSGVPVVLMSAEFRDEADKNLAREVGAASLVERTHDYRHEIDALVLSLDSAVTDASEIAALPPLYFERVASQLTRLVKLTRNSEARYRALIENASDAICLLTAEGVILEANRRLCDIVGYSVAELLGHHIREFSAPGQEVHNGNAFRFDAHQKGTPAYPYAIRRADGATIYLSVSSTTVEIDGQPAILSIGRDVTQSLQAARKLEASEAKFRALVENVPDVIWSATTDGRLTYMSPNVTKLFGVNSEQLMAGGIEGWFAAVDPAQVNYVRRAFENLIDARAPFDIEYRLRNQRGQWTWLHSRASVSREVNGVGQIDGIFSDITARKEMETQLRRSQKADAVGLATNATTHDFNNVLAAVMEHSEYAIEDLGEQTEQIVMNLVVDARDALPSGGSLAIETSMVEFDGTDELLPPAKGQYRVVSVSRDRTRFEQPPRLTLVDPLFATEGKGSDFGRWMSSALKKANGGTLWAYREAGEERAFKIYIPVANQATALRSQNDATDLSGSETVLLVEEDDEKRAAALRMLDDRGYRVLLARDAIEALSVTKSHRPPVDLVLCDVYMRGLNGPKLVPQLQKVFPGIKALFMSGCKNQMILEDGGLKPEMPFIQKPFTPDALALKVREVFKS